MAWHNISGIQNVSNVVSVTDFIASSTDGVFFELLIVIIFIIMLISLMRYGFEASLLTSSFLCWILSIYLVYLNYINFYYSLIFLGIVIFVGLYMYITKQ